ncbi:MAG: bifunctional phosphopantothenoylcysteine decarboxylase/phosphopantothenate--cysteine ligase CoaBC [Candidatus Nitrospinota bacterium M3_3B_026]
MTGRKKIVLGVTGGVAAYKAAEIARRLMDKGLDVRAAMTAHAEKLVTPLTFEALTGQKVLRAGMPRPGEDPMPHITLARWADLVLVAPATANIIGKLANGIADDSLSTLLIATGAPVFMAPAMNTRMLENPAVRENMQKLEARGVRLVGPTTGALACGEEGAGKMADVDEVVSAVIDSLKPGLDLAGIKVIVTAGGTREPIDAIRYIGNRSSGRMGAAVAGAAAARGADVTLIAAPMEAAAPEGVKVVPAPTAADMLDEVGARFDGADILVMAAAVGDYRAGKTWAGKLKKKETWTLRLAANPDILAEMGARKKGQVVVGFAAETEDILAHGRKKLVSKNLDLVVVNDVSRPGAVFGSDYNEVAIIDRAGGTLEVPRAEKTRIAEIILDKAAEALSRKGVRRDSALR